jgi:hypothetical protein
MSFYQTNNSSIVRFSVTPKKAVAPFSNMKRIAAISSVGAGYSGYYTGAVANSKWCFNYQSNWYLGWWYY